VTAPLRLRARVEAPVKDVHRALTDPQAMCTWLAEHATVDLPHTYAFWGRYTPCGDEPRQRPLHVDDRTLRLVWPLDGEDTTVEICLDEENPGRTVLSLTQTHVPDWEEVVAESCVRCVLATFWTLAISNLVDYLAGRELTPKCDFTSPHLREQILVGAPPKVVFESLVRPEQFRQWFGANMEIEPYAGGRWAMGTFDGEHSVAKIVDLQPGRKVSMDWGSYSTTWELEDSGGGTRLTFVHSGFAEDNPPYSGWMGWLTGMGELRRFHEIEDWRPIWLLHEMPGIPAGIHTVS
jgi:uncharacterized protein YndB with AHSA1/START domain